MSGTCFLQFFSHELRGSPNPLKVADISEQAWSEFQCIFAWPCLIVLVILIVLIVSLPVIQKSCTTASQVPPDPPVYVPSSSLKYKNPEVMYILFSLNINYDTILLHTLALKFAVTSREYSPRIPEHPRALWCISEHSLHFGDIFIIFFGIFRSLGTPSKHQASLTCTFILAWPKTCSHLLKPRPQTLWYLLDLTSASVFAQAFDSLHTFEIAGPQLKVGAAHELKPTSRILLLWV